MNKINLKKQKLLFELIDEVEKLKKSDEIIDIDFSLENNSQASDFEKQNDKIFKINMYIITKLYKDKYDEIRNEKGKFNIDEYYEFIEHLNLPDAVYEMYLKMPQMLRENKILSYVTDIPSFMGTIKD